MARRRDLTPPASPLQELTDEQAANLERFVSAPGWRMDEPEFRQYRGWERWAVQILAARWRRTPPEVQQERLADARRGILWPAGLKQFARHYDEPRANGNGM